MRAKLLFLTLSVVVGTTFTSCDNRENEDTVELQAIRKQSNAYEQAFNQGDAKAIANLWTEDATYSDPETGMQLKGRKEIQEDFEALFYENKGTSIQINVNSIDTISKNEAVEIGTATVSKAGDDPIHTAYKALYKKQNSEWLLAEVREVEYHPPVSNYEYLKELEWLVGEWIDEDEDTRITTLFDWNDNRNYLTQHFTVTTEGIKVQEGKQIIAWDPSTEGIRSWIFDSDGGFGEGTWSNDNDQWTVETAFTLPDGRRASAVNVYTRLNDNNYQWESTGREVAGEMLPSIAPVTVKKIKN